MVGYANNASLVFNSMMTLYENAFQFIGPLWGEFISDKQIFSQRDCNMEFKLIGSWEMWM